MGRKLVVLGGLLVGLFLGTGDLSAQARFGGQVSFGDDADFGIGGRVLLDFSQAVTGLALTGSFDYFFPDNLDLGALGVDIDTNYWELNGNAVLQFGIPSAPNMQPYVGGGVNFARASADVVSPGDSFEDSQTDLALNILGGFEFPLPGVTPFVEVRFTFAGDEDFLVRGSNQLVVTGGLLFP